MLTEKHLSSDTSASYTSSRKSIFTPAGTVFLQVACTPSLVESLQADDGLRAFARLPEREHALLLSLAERSDCSLALAYTATRKIVGQATLAPVDAWWRGLPHTYEIAVEVSTEWRRLGIAHQLLALISAHEDWERMIILVQGFHWHWDTQGLGINRFDYRQLLEWFLASYGFVEYLTSEPNIRMDPANILLARMGRHIDRETVNQFFQLLFQSDTLPGM